MSSLDAPSSIDRQRELNEILWRYRSELRRVEVLLEAQLIFASSGRDQGLGVIADLLDERAQKVGELDLRRELLLHAESTPLARSEASPPLIQLSDEAESDGQTGWAEILRDHHHHLEVTAQRIQALVDQTRHSQAAVLDLIAQMTSAGGEPALHRYDRSGQAVRTAVPAMVFDGKV